MRNLIKGITYADIYWGKRFLEQKYMSKKVINGGADMYWSKHKHASHKDRPNVISRQISFKPRSKP
jgi:hypothetical protein